MRTPLNAILGFADLLFEEIPEEEKREFVQIINSNAEQLLRIIDDVLIVSRLDAERLGIDELNFGIAPFLNDLRMTFANACADKNLSISLNIKDEKNTEIRTDRAKLRQALTGLLDNAVKYTFSGGITLGYEIVGKDIRISVSDTGIGIPEDAQKIIFEEFRQVDGSTTRRYSGTGLGLAISKKIVDLLGGKIWVKSIVGKGSIFSFTIPVNYRGEYWNKEFDLDLLGVDKRNVNKPILVIDDDPNVRFTIGQYLTTRGYEVIFAPDAESGIKLAVENKPFAITLDVILPDKDGWSVLKELKENPVTKNIPVILVSFVGDKNIGVGLGAFDFLIKPITADNLLAAFDKLEASVQKKIQKIVIVDDDELEFEKFKKEFSFENISIEYIQDSEYAFNKISEVQPDLIIIDLIMPKVDGISLTHKLKSSRSTRNIPIIISTAKDLSDNEKKSLNSVVEQIAIKSQGHPMDVLKIVRDRIKQQEQESQTLKSRISTDLEKNSLSELQKNINKAVEEILIVDDDPDTLFTMNELVQSMGYKTYLAKSGVECLKMLDHIKPDLILLDIMMPGMDGFQTLKNIRINKSFSNIPVFAVTAKAMSGDKEVILKFGFNDYIPKPVNSTIVSAKISQLFSKVKQNIL
ncbi:MAG: response regulator [Ignavibacterium sp.]